MRKTRPAVILFLIGIIASTQARAKGGYDTVTDNGGTFVITRAYLDTVAVDDPVTGDHMLQEMIYSEKPNSMNGAHIYDEDEVKIPPKYIVGKEAVSFEEYYLNMLASEWRKLPDGIYGLRLCPLVIDDNGNIVYHHIHTLQRLGLQLFPYCQAVGEDTVIAFEKKTCEVLCKAPMMTPAIVNEKNAIATYKDILFDYRIVVKDGSFTLTKGARHMMRGIDHHVFRSK